MDRDSNQIIPRRRRRRGIALWLLLAWLWVGLLLAGLLIDITWLQVRQTQLASMADAAALAAAAQLAHGPDPTCAAVSNYLRHNAGLGLSSSFIHGGTNHSVDSPLELTVNVEFGNWHPTTGTWQVADPPGRSWQLAVGGSDESAAAAPVDSATAAENMGRSEQTNSAADAAVLGNAVRVTVARRVPLLLGRIVGCDSKTLKAESTAAQQPREILFVIDQSGSMNNDTEIWATQAIDQAYPAPNSSPPGTQCLENILADSGWLAGASILRHLDAGLPGAPSNDQSYRWLSETYLPQANQLSTFYRVLGSDSPLARKTKTYRWLIDFQIPAALPQVTPPAKADDPASFNYWSAYLDYIIKPVAGLPPAQSLLRLSTASNPDRQQWPELTASVIQSSYNKIGYRTYLQFLLDLGPERPVAGSSYSPLSVASGFCRWRLDVDPRSAGYGHSFPPREQPLHSVRLALLAALQDLQRKSLARPAEAQDHVGLITFSTLGASRVVATLQSTIDSPTPLESAICALQAAGDDQTNSVTEAGLRLALEQLRFTNPDTVTRGWTDRVVMIVADGPPSGKVSSSAEIDQFVTEHPSSEWYGATEYRYERNAVLMQVMKMRQLGYRIHGVGIGRAADVGLLDRIARIGGTAEPLTNDLQLPWGARCVGGNPAEYQQRLTLELQRMLDSPRVKLVRCLDG